MSKILKVINVHFISNAYARWIIDEMTIDGWGIDSMVEDANRDTWITFYKYDGRFEILVYLE